MIRVLPILLIAAGLLTACVTVSSGRSFNRADYPGLFAALDASPDGYESVIESTGETFRIKSTHVNATRLCRLVEIRGENSFFGESFCKAKGGEWL